MKLLVVRIYIYIEMTSSQYHCTSKNDDDEDDDDDDDGDDAD